MFRREQVIQCTEARKSRSLEGEGINWWLFTLSGTTPDFVSVKIGLHSEEVELRKRYRVTIEEVE